MSDIVVVLEVVGMLNKLDTLEEEMVKVLTSMKFLSKVTDKSINQGHRLLF
jgi:hypothetical protein